MIWSVFLAYWWSKMEINMHTRVNIVSMTLLEITQTKRKKEKLRRSFIFLCSFLYHLICRKKVNIRRHVQRVWKEREISSLSVLMKFLAFQNLLFFLKFILRKWNKESIYNIVVINQRPIWLHSYEWSNKYWNVVLCLL